MVFLLLLWGLKGQKLEMLFVLQKRGQGLGKRLLRYGIMKYGINELGNVEQNPQAKGFS